MCAKSQVLDGTRSNQLARLDVDGTGGSRRVSWKPLSCHHVTMYDLCMMCDGHLRLICIMIPVLTVQ